MAGLSRRRRRISDQGYSGWLPRYTTQCSGLGCDARGLWGGARSGARWPLDQRPRWHGAPSGPRRPSCGYPTRNARPKPITPVPFCSRPPSRGVANMVPAAPSNFLPSFDPDVAVSEPGTDTSLNPLRPSPCFYFLHPRQPASVLLHTTSASIFGTGASIPTNRVIIAHARQTTFAFQCLAFPGSDPQRRGKERGIVFGEEGQAKEEEKQNHKKLPRRDIIGRGSEKLVVALSFCVGFFCGFVGVSFLFCSDLYRFTSRFYLPKVCFLFSFVACGLPGFFCHCVRLRESASVASCLLLLLLFVFSFCFG